jgi:hypothetical protein
MTIKLFVLCDLREASSGLPCSSCARVAELTFGLLPETVARRSVLGPQLFERAANGSCKMTRN